METERNEYLWKKAQNRAAFKVHALTYVLVNVGFWGLYLYMTTQPWGHRVSPLADLAHAGLGHWAGKPLFFGLRKYESAKDGRSRISEAFAKRIVAGMRNEE